jgi:hypothetical protein
MTTGGIEFFLWQIRKYKYFDSHERFFLKENMKEFSLPFLLVPRNGNGSGLRWVEQILVQLHKGFG